VERAREEHHELGCGAKLASSPQPLLQRRRGRRLTGGRTQGGTRSSLAPGWYEFILSGFWFGAGDMRVIKIKSKIRRLHLKELARELADAIFHA